MEMNPTSTHEDSKVQSLALPSGLRIRHCHGLWCRSQRQLGSRVAVTVAQAPIQSHTCLKNKKKKKKKRCPGVSDLIKPSTETSRKLEPKLYLFICFFFFFLKGHNCGIWKFPGWGSNQSCTCQPTPQPHKPQQLQIQAVSVHSNTRSLGPGIEHISSWIPVGFVSTEPQ